jgi:hypothetical protein
LAKTATLRLSEVIQRMARKTTLNRDIAPDADNMSDEQRAPLEQWIVDKAVGSSDDNFDYTGIDYVIFAMPLSGSFTTQMMPIGEVVMTSGAHGFRLQDTKDGADSSNKSPKFRFSENRH